MSDKADHKVSDTGGDIRHREFQDAVHREIDHDRTGASLDKSHQSPLEQAYMSFLETKENQKTVEHLAQHGSVEDIQAFIAKNEERIKTIGAVKQDIGVRLNTTQTNEKLNPLMIHGA
jgi:hypothetical protein